MKIDKVLKPGGIFVISFRPQYFWTLKLVRERLWDRVNTVLQEEQGRILGSSTIYTWQTSKEVEMLFEKKFKLTLLTLRGIGNCSGIPHDPHDYVCQPSTLSEEEKKHLMNLELKLGEAYPDFGRYMLAVASKSK